jgi:pimeloyl-ACP methyl ester carboxylesterase
MDGTTNGTVTSADGTTIGYEASGTGPTLIAVHGGTADRTRWQAVGHLLAREHTLWAVDRRGRGLSGDADDYDLHREAEDLAALVEAAGPGSVLLAHSYGATVALAAAPALSSLAGMVLYEPALQTPGHQIVDDDVFAEAIRLIEQDRRDEALTLFFRRVIGLPDAAIDAMRATPIWAARVAAVHTLPREGYAARDVVLDPDALGRLPFPVLVMRGTESPAWLQSAAAAAHRAIPNSRFVELDGQAHMAMDTAPETFAHEVLTFSRGVRAVVGA